MRPKFKATDMTPARISEEAYKRGWENFRFSVEGPDDGELYIEKLYWWEVKRLPRLRAVK